MQCSFVVIYKHADLKNCVSKVYGIILFWPFFFYLSVYDVQFLVFMGLMNPEVQVCMGFHPWCQRFLSKNDTRYLLCINLHGKGKNNSLIVQLGSLVDFEENLNRSLVTLFIKRNDGPNTFATKPLN